MAISPMTVKPFTASSSSLQEQVPALSTSADLENRIQRAYERGYEKAEQFFTWVFSHSYFQRPVILPQEGDLILVSPEQGAGYRTCLGMLGLYFSGRILQGDNPYYLGTLGLVTSCGLILSGLLYMGHSTRVFEKACGYLNTLPIKVCSAQQRIFSFRSHQD